MLSSPREAKAKLKGCSAKEKKNCSWCYTIEIGLTGKLLAGIYLAKNEATGEIMGNSFTS